MKWQILCTIIFSRNLIIAILKTFFHSNLGNKTSENPHKDHNKHALTRALTPHHQYIAIYSPIMINESVYQDIRVPINITSGSDKWAKNHSDDQPMVRALPPE